MDERARKKAAEAVLEAHGKRKRFPAVLFWRVTERQVVRARYRPPPNPAADELSTFQVREIVDQAARLGVLKINFHAEDPVLRDDVGAIVAHARARGIFVEIAASGPLLAQKAAELRQVGRISTPLLGKRPIHDSLRVGRNLYDQAAEGISAARKLGIPLTLLYTLTNKNAKEMEYVLQLAAKSGAMFCLDPLPTETHGFLGVEKFHPAPEAFRACTDLLLGIYKKRGDMIRNSREALEYLAHWPKLPPRPSLAGSLYAAIDAEGNLSASEMRAFEGKSFSLKKHSLEEAFRALSGFTHPNSELQDAVELELMCALGRKALHAGTKVFS